MSRSRKFYLLLAVTSLAASLLSCGAHDSDEYFVFVAANLQVPYWQAAGRRFFESGRTNESAHGLLRTEQLRL